MAGASASDFFAVLDGSELNFGGNPMQQPAMLLISNVSTASRHDGVTGFCTVADQRSGEAP